MAAKKATKAPNKPIVADIPPEPDAETPETLDDLLGELPTQVKGNVQEATSAEDLSAKLGKTQQREKEKADKAAAKEKAKAEKAAAKAEREKKPLKGIPVSFTTKGTGEKIEGLGVLYYVVRQNGKLYYKEASQVTILEDDGKEPDDLKGPDESKLKS